jgi:hypothetical protein
MEFQFRPNKVTRGVDTIGRRRMSLSFDLSRSARNVSRSKLKLHRLKPDGISPTRVTLFFTEFCRGWDLIDSFSNLTFAVEYNRSS